MKIGTHGLMTLTSFPAEYEFKTFKVKKYLLKIQMPHFWEPELHWVTRIIQRFAAQSHSCNAETIGTSK